MLLIGNCLDKLKELEEESVQCCVTSPPYWGLRDYDDADQLGQEDHPEEFVEKLTEIFMEVHRVLKDDGTFWLNIGDTYFGAKGGHFDGANSITNDGTGTKYRESRKAPSKHVKILYGINLIQCPKLLTIGVRSLMSIYSY